MKLPSTDTASMRNYSDYLLLAFTPLVAYWGDYTIAFINLSLYLAIKKYEAQHGN